MRSLEQFMYIWKFEPDQENAYRSFSHPYNLLYLQLICSIVSLDHLAYIAIDFSRDVNYTVVFSTRVTLLLTLVTVLLVSLRKPLRPSQLDGLIIFCLSGTVVFLFIAVSFGHMPVFFLPNASVSILMLVVTVSGLRFRQAIYFNLLFLLAIVAYIQFIRPDPFFVSQYPNLITTFIFSSLAGGIIENIKRKSFLQHERLLVEKKKVEELHQQKTQIISILSHDVVSPLNSLAGLLELQAKGHMSAEEIAPFLLETRKRLGDVSTMVYGLVRWSRMQLAGFVVEKKNTELVNLIKESLALVQPNATEKLVELKLSENKSIWVNVDEEMIRIAIRNLLTNAIKFAKKETQVVIVFHQLRQRVIVDITNTGSAIPPDLQSKLFSFHGSASLGTLGEKGTGLGLPMASSFMALNDGTVELKSSDPTTGITTFSISLPVLTL